MLLKTLATKLLSWLTEKTKIFTLGEWYNFLHYVFYVFNHHSSFIPSSHSLGVLPYPFGIHSFSTDLVTAATVPQFLSQMKFQVVLYHGHLQERLGQTMLAFSAEAVLHPGTSEARRSWMPHPAPLPSQNTTTCDEPHPLLLNKKKLNAALAMQYTLWGSPRGLTSRI